MKLLSLFGVLLLGLSGCAATSAPVGEPGNRSDKGTVYFYRNTDYEGQETDFLVKENGTTIGKLGNGTYFYHYAAPGRQFYAVVPESADVTGKENGRFVMVVAGESHYVQAIAQQTPYTVRALVYVKYPQQARPAIKRLTYRDGR